MSKHPKSLSVLPKYVEDALAASVWLEVPQERRVVCCGGSLSMMGLNQAFACVEAAVGKVNGDVDVLVVSPHRFADMRMWRVGDGDCPFDGRKVWGATVVRDGRVPPALAVVCSKSKGGTFGTIEVVVGS